MLEAMEDAMKDAQRRDRGMPQVAFDFTGHMDTTKVAQSAGFTFLVQTDRSISLSRKMKSETEDDTKV